MAGGLLQWLWLNVNLGGVFMAFYLKYRSKTVGELDIAKVREGLQGVLRSYAQGKLPHALLFSGPRGSGKTSAARILAKAINCKKQLSVVSSQLSVKEKKEKVNKKADNKKLKTETHPEGAPLGKPIIDFEPCNECDACLAIMKGRALDVIEIDAASHRGIDDIRDLREKVKLAPTQLKFKVYIIDEVHMLTTEAFNALLKTLEEPPKNVVFILCTTELHKLPETIVSRCVRIDFHKGSVEEVMRSMQRVVEGEEIKIERAALKKIAERVDGSFRDAHKMLEQLSWTLTDNKGQIEVEDVKQLVGLAEEQVERVLDLLRKRDAKGVVQLIEELMNGGENVRVVFGEVLERLHGDLLGYYGAGERAKLKTTTKSLRIEELEVLIKRLNRALYEMKTAVIEQLPLEMAIMEWLETDSDVGKEADKRSKEMSSRGDTTNVVSTKQSSRTKNAPDGRLLPRSGGANRMALSSDRNRNPGKDKANWASSNPVKQDESNLTGAVNSRLTGGEQQMSLETLQQRWNELLEAVKPKNHSVQALLRSSKPKEVNGEQIVIEVWYPFHFDKLNSHPHRQIVEEALVTVFGWQGARLVYVLGQRMKQETKKSNGNMILEDEVPEFFTKSNHQVSDGGNSGYAAKRKKVTKGLANEEDEALIKFAEEIFGG